MLNLFKEVFLEKEVLKNFANFTETQIFKVSFLITLKTSGILLTSHYDLRLKTSFLKYYFDA